MDAAAIATALPDATWAIVYPRPGQYLPSDSILVEVGQATDENQERHLRAAFVIGQQRRLTQDAMFGFRQLVDIALKSLGINDPTTAEHALSCIGDALMRLAGRSFPSRVLDDQGQDQQRLSVWFNRPSFTDFVDTALDQVRRAAATDVAVTLHLLNILGAIARPLPESRTRAVQRQLDQIVSQIRQSSFIPGDRNTLFAAARVVKQSIKR